MSGSSLRAITDDSFESEVLQTKLPVLVDFWAPWCRPCQVLMPILEEVSQEYSGRVVILKINISENEEVAAKLNIRGIPALILYKESEIIGSKSGLLSKSELKDFLDKNL